MCVTGVGMTGERGEVGSVDCSSGRAPLGYAGAWVRVLVRDRRAPGVNRCIR